MEDNIRSELWKRGNTFEAFSVCLDESTGRDDTAQLAIFVRGVDSHFNVTDGRTTKTSWNEKYHKR